MEAICKYLRPCCGIMRAPLANIIRKTILVETYGDYSQYATPYNITIARMFHFPPDNNKLLPEKDVQTVWAHTAEYKIDKKIIYDILD